MSLPSSMPPPGNAPHDTPDEARSARAQLRHDLRTPLTQVIGYAELLLEEAETNSALQAATPDLEHIRAAGQRMLALINTRLNETQEAAPFHQAGAAYPNARQEHHLAAYPAPPAPPAQEGASILMVDDSAPDRELLARRLESEGHRVQAVGNGEAALELMRAGEFDLVVLDLMMPGMNGMEVLGQMHNDPQLHLLPVIMLSALDDVDVVVRGIEAGAEDYLLKPVNPALLRVRVNACLEKKRLRDTEARLFAQLQEGYTRLSELEHWREEWTQMLVHDLRTPLTVIMGALQTFEVAGELSEIQSELTGIASRSATTLLGLINDLLDVAKMESGTLTLQSVPVSPLVAISDAVASVQALAVDKELALGMEVAQQLPMVHVDRDKIDRVLVNLLANAIKFTSQGEVVVGAAHEGEIVRFWVRDTGEGIPPDAQPLIFQKFGQVQSGRARIRNSTGLGLTFCKLVVEAHSGVIGVSSQEGQGSTFWFSMPLAISPEPNS